MNVAGASRSAEIHISEPDDSDDDDTQDSQRKQVSFNIILQLDIY